LHLDNAKEELVRKLTEAIIGAVSENDGIAKAVYNLRAAGLDMELSLHGTISLSHWPDQTANALGHPFLMSAHLRVNP